MSLWDLEPDIGVSSSLEEIIQERPINWDKILDYPELFQSFRKKEPYLVDFFTNPDVFRGILDNIKYSSEKRMVKIGTELFLVYGSPLIEVLFSNPSLYLPMLLKDAEKIKRVNMGNIFRILSEFVSLKSKDFISYIMSNADTLTYLLNNSSDVVFYDFLIHVFRSKSFNWGICILINILNDGIVDIPNVYSKEAELIVNVGKNANRASISKQGLIKLIFSVIEEDILSGGDLMYLSNSIVSVFDNCPTDIARLTIFKIASRIPQSESLVRRAVCVFDDFRHVTQVHIECLYFLAKYTPSTVFPSFQIILEKAVQSMQFTLFLNAVFKLLRKVHQIESYREIIIRVFKPVILKELGSYSLRRICVYAAFLIQLSILIDPHIEPENDWLEIKNKYLCNKDIIESYSMDHSEDLGSFVDISEQNCFNFPDSIAFDNNKEEKINEEWNPSFEAEKETKIDDTSMNSSFDFPQDIKFDETPIEGFSFENEPKTSENETPFGFQPEFPSNSFEFPSSSFEFPAFGNDSNSESTGIQFEPDEQFNEEDKEKLELFKKFIELLHDQTWNNSGTKATDLFKQNEGITTPEEAFDFLVKNN